MLSNAYSMIWDSPVILREPNAIMPIVFFKVGPSEKGNNLSHAFKIAMRESDGHFFLRIRELEAYISLMSCDYIFEPK